VVWLLFHFFQFSSFVSLCTHLYAATVYSSYIARASARRYRRHWRSLINAKWSSADEMLQRCCCCCCYGDEVNDVHTLLGCTAPARGRASAPPQRCTANRRARRLFILMDAVSSQTNDDNELAGLHQSSRGQLPPHSSLNRGQSSIFMLVSAALLTAQFQSVRVGLAQPRSAESDWLGVRKRLTTLRSELHLECQSRTSQKFARCSVIICAVSTRQLHV